MVSEFSIGSSYLVLFPPTSATSDGFEPVPNRFAVFLLLLFQETAVTASQILVHLEDTVDLQPP